jgi:hypothetical protein
MNRTKWVVTQSALAFIVSLAIPTSGFATALPPVLQGLGGAGRGGVAKESVFSNPAATGLLNDASAYFYYEMPSVPDFDAGGRAYGLGISDGGTNIKGAFAYVRSSRARIGDGGQDFEDRKELRFSSGFQVGEGIYAGFGTRYVWNAPNGDYSRFFQSDIGVLFPLFAGLTAGITYENIFNRSDDLPPTIGLGGKYPLGAGFTAFADGYRLMNGKRKGERGFSLAMEMAVWGDFTLRGARFQDGLRLIKGWSGGLTWAGPKFSLDYAFRVAGTGPREKDHTFGLSARF